MFSVTKNDCRLILYYNFSRGLSVEDSFNEMSSILGKYCPSLERIKKWALEFQEKNSSFKKKSHPGRSADLSTLEHVAVVQAAIQQNRRISIKQLEDYVQIANTSCLYRIIHSRLEMKKLCTMWVPKTLTDEQRDNRVKWSKEMLKQFNSGESDDASFIITGNETWLYYENLPKKSENSSWVFEEEDKPVKVKKSESMHKRMVVVFFDKKGIIKVVVLEEQRKVTSRWYTETCLSQVFQALEKLDRNLRFFHHDNTLAYRAGVTQEFLEKMGMQVVNHPEYSPDLAPCDFGLFPYMKVKMSGQKYSSHDQLIATFEEECSLIPKEKWEDWFDDWFLRMKKCIACNGEYV